MLKMFIQGIQSERCILIRMNCYQGNILIDKELSFWIWWIKFILFETQRLSEVDISHRIKKRGQEAIDRFIIEMIVKDTYM